MPKILYEINKYLKIKLIYANNLNKNMTLIHTMPSKLSSSLM